MKRLLLTLLLCGCADKEIVYTPQEVDKPIAIECKVKEVGLPSFPNYKSGDTLFTKVQVLIEREQLHLQYEDELVAENKACQ